jgi:hypothetical protein
MSASCRWEGLGGADQARLFGRDLGGDEAGAAAVAWLGPEAPTLPFEILEVTRALADAGALVADGDSWRVDPARVGDLGSPESGAHVARRAGALPDRPVGWRLQPALGATAHRWSP